jgi:acyl carrier protein
MSNTNVYDDLKEIIARATFGHRAPAELRDEMLLQSDLNVDSPMLVEIVLDIEERYSIHIKDEEIDRLRTVGDLVQLISGVSTRAR